MTDQPEIRESDVVMLHKPSGELSFRAQPDAYQLDEIVQYQGVGFQIKGVRGDNEDNVYFAYPLAIELLGDVEPFALTLEPDDVVVLKAKTTLSASDADDLKASAAPYFPGHRILVLDENVDVGRIPATPGDQPAQP